MTDSFDLDEWLQSVEGRTVEVTQTDGYGRVLGAMEPRGFRYYETLCGNCEEMVVLIRANSLIGHCPGCGRTPGALELGTESVEDWREMPEEVKAVER